MNVSKTNQRTTSDTFQQIKLLQHLVHKGTHHEQRKDTEPTCSHAYLHSMYPKERDISKGGRPISQPKF